MKKIILIILVMVAISGCFGKKSLRITHKETGASITISEDGIEEIEIGTSVDFGDIQIEAIEEESAE